MILLSLLLLKSGCCCSLCTIYTTHNRNDTSDCTNGLQVSDSTKSLVAIVDCWSSTCSAVVVLVDGVFWPSDKVGRGIWQAHTFDKSSGKEIRALCCCWRQTQATFSSGWTSSAAGTTTSPPPPPLSHIKLKNRANFWSPPTEQSRAPPEAYGLHTVEL